jgi:hypothetical protein
MKKRHFISRVLSYFLNAFRYLDVYFVIGFGGGQGAMHVCSECHETQK